MLDNNDAGFDDLLAQLDQVEQPWSPEHDGDQVFGVVSGIDYIRTKVGTTMPLLRLTAPDGVVWKVAAGRAALRGELDRRSVQPGDRLAIRYTGMTAGKDGGRDFHGYRVAHQPVGPRDASAAFDGSREAVDDLGLVPGAIDGTFGSDDPAAEF
jgi:hypothetical protein